MQARMRQASLFAVVAVALVVLGDTAVAQSVNPVLGTWKQNIAKSKYDPGPAPKSVTRTYEPFEGDGIKFTNDSINADGSRRHITTSYHYDGKEYPFSDSDNRFDTIALKRIDAYTTETTLKKAGKVVQTGRNVVSKDGKTMTQTQKGTNATGPYTNVLVSDKQ